MSEHTDLVAHHLDDGVPWPEAFEGKPFPPKVRESLDYRIAQLKGHTAYLAVTPIAIGRKTGFTSTGAAPWSCSVPRQ